MPCSLTQHLPPYPLPRAPTLPPPSLSRLTFAPSFLPPSLDPRALRLSAASVTMSNLSSPGSLFLPPSALSTPTSYPTFFVAKRPKRRRRRRGGGQGQEGSGWVGGWGGVLARCQWWRRRRAPISLPKAGALRRLQPLARAGRPRSYDWIGRRSRRLSLRETSRPFEWMDVTHREACRRGTTRHRPPQAAGRA